MTRLPEQPGVYGSMSQSNASARSSGEVASPHRAGHSSGLHPEDQPYQSDDFREKRRATTRRPEPIPVDDEFEEEDEEEEEYGIDTGYDDPPHMPSSVHRYQSVQQPYPQTYMRIQYHNSNIPLRASRTQTQDYQTPAPQQPEPRTTEPHPRRRSALRVHPLIYVGLGMLIMVLLWLALTALVQWWQVKQDDARYGYPRTFQIDAVVGHSDSAASPSHFIVLNLRGHVRIIEFPGGDATKAKVYIGPDLLGPGQDLTPVTLSFNDVNGTGKPDMIVTVGTTHYLYHNTGTAFVPPKP